MNCLCVLHCIVGRALSRHFWRFLLTERKCFAFPAKFVILKPKRRQILRTDAKLSIVFSGRVAENGFGKRKRETLFLDNGNVDSTNRGNGLQ